MHPTLISLFTAVMAITLLVSPVCANGEGEFAVRDGRVEAELIAQHTALVPGETAQVGLRLKMDDGWHTYWKNPGDSGMATSIQWDLPEGFVAHDIDWPAPEYYEVSGLASFAYEGEIVLPVRIEVPKDFAGSEVTLRATADWLMCKEQCEPGTAELQLTMPIERNPADVMIGTEHSDLFAVASDRLPKPVRSDAANATLRDGEIALGVTDTFPRIDQSSQASARFFPADPMAIAMSAAQSFSPTDYAGIIINLEPNALSDPPEQLRGVVAYQNGDNQQFYEIDVPLRRVASGD